MRCVEKNVEAFQSSKGCGMKHLTICSILNFILFFLDPSDISCWKDMDVEPKIGGFTPQIIHLFIGFSMIFTHPFWWFSPLFLVQHPYGETIFRFNLSTPISRRVAPKRMSIAKMNRVDTMMVSVPFYCAVFVWASSIIPPTGRRQWGGMRRKKPFDEQYVDQWEYPRVT